MSQGSFLVFSKFKSFQVFKNISVSQLLSDIQTFFWDDPYLSGPVAKSLAKSDTCLSLGQLRRHTYFFPIQNWEPTLLEATSNLARFLARIGWWWCDKKNIAIFGNKQWLEHRHEVKSCSPCAPTKANPGNRHTSSLIDQSWSRSRQGWGQAKAAKQTLGQRLAFSAERGTQVLSQCAHSMITSVRF